MSETTLLQDAVHRLKEGKKLTPDEISGAFRVMMCGDAPDGLIGAFLGILSTRVPTGGELFGATRVMKECVERVELPDPHTLLDTCGTGGAPKTFNVSTASGIVAAACGVRVAKHGNRSRTGRGSAEVLESLGINIHSTVEQQIECLNRVGICFCFAPNHHKSVARVMPVRKTLGFPTIFNMVGPLTNPCNAGCQLLGVWDQKLLQPMAEALQSGGVSRGAVVYSKDGLDEVSVSAPTVVLFVDKNEIQQEVIQPEYYGLTCWNKSEVVASSLESAVQMLISVFKGEHGAPRDMVVLNTAVGLFVSSKVDSIQEGVDMSICALDQGDCLQLLEKWKVVLNNTPST